VDIETANALTTFTTRYCDAWHEKQGTWPQSADFMASLRRALSLRLTITLSGSRSRLTASKM
jgi:hypothetical protein